jgi:hypothetical protein
MKRSRTARWLILLAAFIGAPLTQGALFGFHSAAAEMRPVVPGPRPPSPPVKPPVNPRPAPSPSTPHTPIPAPHTPPGPQPGPLPAP